MLLGVFSVIVSTNEGRVLVIVLSLANWALGWTAKWVLLGRWL